jgi:hypothetical protein
MTDVHHWECQKAPEASLTFGSQAGAARLKAARGPGESYCDTILRRASERARRVTRRFYIYCFYDRLGDPAYVGKGAGSRINSHHAAGRAYKRDGC